MAGELVNQLSNDYTIRLAPTPGTARYEVSTRDNEDEELLAEMDELQSEIATEPPSSQPPPSTTTSNLRGSRSSGHHLPEAQVTQWHACRISNLVHQTHFHLGNAYILYNSSISSLN